METQVAPDRASTPLAQDRLVKHLRQEYGPEWNTHFARPVVDFPDQHRALTPQLDLAAILCHVEERVVGNDYTFSFAGRRYRIARGAAQAGMRRQRAGCTPASAGFSGAAALIPVGTIRG